MRPLIFGSGGQVGLELAALCRRRGIAAVLATRDGGDIAIPDQVIHLVRAAAPSIIINAAAYTKVDKAEQEVSAAFRDNQEGPAVLARIAARNNVPLIHLSTDYVFSGEKSAPYMESDTLAPLGVYGASKAAGETAVRSLWDKHVIMRTAWLYGYFGDNFVKTMLRFARARKELAVVADQFGSPTATIDLAHFIMEVAVRASAGESIWGTYHFAGGGTASRYEFACAIMDALSARGVAAPAVKPTTSVDCPTPARRPKNSSLCCDLAATRFGISALDWRPRVREVVGGLLEMRQGSS